MAEPTPTDDCIARAYDRRYRRAAQRAKHLSEQFSAEHRHYARQLAFAQTVNACGVDADRVARALRIGRT